MHALKTISLPHYRLAGELAGHIRGQVDGGNVRQLSIPSLARKFAVSETVLTRLFKQRFGTTIHAYIILQKMLAAKTLLRDDSLPVKTIAFQLGYTELSNFSRDFSRATGMSPNAFRACGPCMEVMASGN